MLCYSTVRVTVTVPPTNERGPQYMDQALAAMHQANARRLPVNFEFAWHEGSVAVFCRFPAELRGVVEGQLYAQYPDCRIETLNADTLNPAADETTWTIELRLRPGIFPIKRYVQFEDALNRVTADPLTAILTTLAPDRHERTKSRVQISLRPTHRRIQARAKRCLRRLAQPFFRGHPRLTHLYAVVAASRLLPVRAVAALLGLLGRTHWPQTDHALSTSGTRAHDREEDLQAGMEEWRNCKLRIENCKLPTGRMRAAV